MKLRRYEQVLFRGRPTSGIQELGTIGMENTKSSCVTSVHSPKILVPEATSKGYVEIEPGECFDAENINSKTRRGRKMKDKSNCLMAKETDFMKYSKNARIRRLTPVECERLQTVNDKNNKGKLIKHLYFTNFAH